MTEISISFYTSLCKHVSQPIGVFEKEHYSVLFLNPAARSLLNYNGNNPKLTEILPSLTNVQDDLSASLRNKHSFKRSFQLNDGAKTWVQFMAEAIEDHPTHVFFSLTDLSIAIQTEESLLREIQKFEALFNYASMGIIVADQSGTITMANPYASKQFEYNHLELIGKKVEDLIPKRFQHTHQHNRDKYNQKPQARSMGADLELFGLRKSGTEFPVQISLGHFENESGKYALAFIVDDTKRKANEKEIIRQKEEMAAVNEKMKQLNELLEIKVLERTQMLQDTLKELEQSRDDLRQALDKEKQLNDMKSRFVSMASHEFRTPLSTILSSITLLSKYTTSEEQSKREKHIDRIKASVTNLTDILNEFLSLGRIEDGKIEPKWAEFSLPDLVFAVTRQLDPLRKTGQVIKHEHFGNAEIVLDPSLLKNILINLFSNAIKFSPEHSVITITTHTDNKDILIDIKDEGMGISKEDQRHLFERFFRGANVVNIQGTGLGLHIVSRYVQMMNGSIKCKSELDKGTRFIIKFKQHKFADSN